MAFDRFVGVLGFRVVLKAGVMTMFALGVIGAGLAMNFFATAASMAAESACGIGADACLASCKRFEARDPRFSACNNFCARRSAPCAPESAPEDTPQDVSAANAESGSVTMAPSDEIKVEPLPNKAAVVKEQERNAEMLTAIRSGNLKVIRRLIETQGLHPTYVFTHEFNPVSRTYDGQVSKLRLVDIFNDTSTLRSDKVGLDEVMKLFLELGMDVNATLPSTEPQSIKRTAWGPNLRFMELAKDRDARLRAFESALQAGMVPKDELRDWLFSELTQVCGRDKSKFSIQVVDMLINYLGPALGPALQEGFWRFGERGPETVSDVLDRSFAPPQPKNYIEKAEFALKDNMWEQCAPLSRRINRFLTQGS